MTPRIRGGQGRSARDLLFIGDGLGLVWTLAVLATAAIVAGLWEACK